MEDLCFGDVVKVVKDNKLNKGHTFASECDYIYNKNPYK